MKKELRDKWVAALRSGNYKQGRQKLHVRLGNDHEYCCLGVLCDVAGVQMGEAPAFGELVEYYVVNDLDITETSTLLWDTREKVGLRNESIHEILWRLNDGANDTEKSNIVVKVAIDKYLKDNKPKTFNEIADWIEIHVLTED